MTAPPLQNPATGLVPGQRLSLPPADPRQAAPLPFDPVLIGAGINVALRSIGRRLFGWKRYPGKAPDICAAVVEDCWTGEVCAGPAGHVQQFWTRHLAMWRPTL